jgi:hypothetical protein
MPKAMNKDSPRQTTSNVGRLVAYGIGLRVTQFLIRTIGFRRAVRLLDTVATFRDPRQERDQRKWAAEVDKVTLRPRTPSCLDRSVFLWFVLRLHGIESDLRIGITPNADTIDGHAWVELDGAVLNDAEDIADHFAVFDGDPIGLAFS